MSRTIRRKTLTSKWPWDWSKAFGYNYEYAGAPGYAEFKDNMAWRDNHFVRARTKREKFEMWYVTHRESKSGNHRSPGKDYRMHRQNEWRSHNKQELHRELSRLEYEGDYWTNPLSCWWDWN